MRKLAPMFVMTSIVALVSGNALATMGDKATTPSTTDSSMASPTVKANTNTTQNLSYSDKSNTSPGTNAVMDDKSKPMMAATTDDDKNLAKTKKRVKKAKVAARSDTMMHGDGSMSTMPGNSTNAAAANSTTGKSLGQ